MDEHAKQPLLLFTPVKITAITKVEAVAVEVVVKRTSEAAVEIAEVDATRKKETVVAITEAVAAKKKEAVVAITETFATRKKEANEESAVKATVILEAAAKIAQAQVLKNA